MTEKREAEMRMCLPEGSVSSWAATGYLEITICFLRILERPREAQTGKLKTKLPARSFPLQAVRAQAEGGEGLFVVFSFPAQQAH